MSSRLPFIGPRPFMEADAELFFGRDDELAALTAEVVSTQILLFYASSGSGKSSLIGAGLVPEMRREGFTVSQARVKTLMSSDGESPVDRLREVIKDSARTSSPEQPSLLVLDQFEEIVISVTYEELKALSETVNRTMAENPLARVVISFREEYLARIEELFTRAGDISVGHFHLDRLSRRGAHEAFERSLETVGFQVEPEAKELFLSKLVPPTRRRRSDIGFEPLYLQLLGAQLWTSLAGREPVIARPEVAGSVGADQVVTISDVSHLVDFDQAIEEFYDSTITRVCKSNRFAEKTLRDWIDRELLTPDETRSVVRRRVPETEGIPTVVLDDLVSLGLLRTEPRAEDLWLELAHDQLVERVREFNRLWWTDRLQIYLLGRDSRVELALTASRWDTQQWIQSRATLWSFSTGLRESGLQLAHLVGRWRPSGQRQSRPEMDRLALRAFVISGSLVNFVILLYRQTNTVTPPGMTTTGIEGLDAAAAKRKLQATSLNLGRTDQLLAAVNIAVTAGWVRSLARSFTLSATRAVPRRGRQRLLAGVLLGADVGLSLLRWAIRNGLLASCLDPDQPGAEGGRQLGSLVPDIAEVGEVRRATNLKEVAGWSEELPVLLVLDGDDDANNPAAFEHFRTSEVPVYADALKRRGALVAWCCRADVREHGWRSILVGLGFPSRGRRTYYMVEAGNVVAWRVVRRSEVPPQLDDVGQQPGSAQLQAQTRLVKDRFTDILTSLIVSNEAMPSPWRASGDQLLVSALGRRRGGKPGA